MFGIVDVIVVAQPIDDDIPYAREYDPSLTANVYDSG